MTRHPHDVSVSETDQRRSGSPSTTRTRSGADLFAPGGKSRASSGPIRLAVRSVPKRVCSTMRAARFPFKTWTMPSGTRAGSQAAMPLLNRATVSAAVLALAIFVLDTRVPLGVDIDVLYVVPLLLATLNGP